MPESEKQLPDPLSKSQRKRDMLELQKLGQTLIDLSASQLAQVPVPDILLDAIRLMHTLKANEAKRRHLQYIGKLMREIDVEAIHLALKKIQYSKDQQTTKFHAVEQVRDQLIAGDDKDLQQFLEQHPQADRQQLRQLIRKAKQDHKTNKNTGGATALFRYLRDLKT